ncbi:hypothetical protein DPMN_007894 [Dreissena polymorpha]|uniref:Uncharacterized protein n=1 Tax=Dreissena polymorpha TaxID=45954 RepID=A0A9D4MV43_DREPO|nr:hypothetical protein DPMN_007894 [Dreissena polymorpha]
MTQRDAVIKILLDHAEELYYFHFRGETTQVDNTCSEILIKLETAKEMKKHGLRRNAKDG